MSGKKQFYVFVEEQHDGPVEVWAYSHEDAAIAWVTQFECDTAMEHGIASEGNSITCRVSDAHHSSIFVVTGEYCPNYYAKEVF
ncbi:MAG: hypothetical protein ACRC2U_01305 [Aeromonas sp.]